FEQVLVFPSGKTIKGKMHLYELTLGSRLVDIAARETSTPGLGTWSWTSWSQILPLTPEAATALLKEPGLGKAVDPVYLAGPYLTTVAQRFYFLQLPGAPMPRKHPPHVLVGPAASTVVPRGTHSMGACGNRIGVTVDLGGARIVVRLQFAEATAQEIAQALRRTDIA